MNALSDQQSVGFDRTHSQSHVQSVMEADTQSNALKPMKIRFIKISLADWRSDKQLYIEVLRDTARQLKLGGVGYYPGSNFIHVDTGRVRYW